LDKLVRFFTGEPIECISDDNNRLNQLGIAVSLGLVAIWCMHFVGNRAIILGDGEAQLQLDYNSGFTALSAFLPIVFLFIALTLFELRQPSEGMFWPFLMVSGFIAGLSVTGMHYVGNFGISNYFLHNPAQFVIGAAAIAIVASIIALSLFFYFKEKWVNSFPKRMASSVVLASAVSGMHWVASVGTTYTLRRAITYQSDRRNINLIVAMVCVSWFQHHIHDNY
jgi:NO-binding membrane sensor protein with MHYT domain